MDGEHSAAELRNLVTSWFKDASDLILSLRTLARIGKQSFPFSVATFDEQEEGSFEQQLLRRRQMTYDTMLQEEQHLNSLLEPLTAMTGNKQLWELFNLAYANIDEDFSTSRYSGGRFAWAVLQSASYDLLRWSQDVRAIYRLSVVIIDGTTVSPDDLTYAAVPAGAGSGQRYSTIQHVHKFRELQQECPLSDADLDSINGRLFREKAQILSILEQRKNREVSDKLADALSKQATASQVISADGKPKGKTKGQKSSGKGYEVKDRNLVFYSTLKEWHKYDTDQFRNGPAPSKELAGIMKVQPGTISKYFKKMFLDKITTTDDAKNKVSKTGYDIYCDLCNSKSIEIYFHRREGKFSRNRQLEHDPADTAETDD